MINILLCGNKKVFDGALTELISITNKTKETINCYILTMDLSRLKPEYVCITDEQIDFLNKVVRSKNSENKVTKIDVTDLYEEEFMKCKNESAYCTPYTLLRLLIDKIPNIPDKILYLDIDMMFNKDISELYNIDIEEYEYAAVREKYGKWFIRPDYINAGMLLINMKIVRKTKLFEKARDLIRRKKCYLQTKMQYLGLQQRKNYYQVNLMNNQSSIKKILYYATSARGYYGYHIHIQKTLNNGM